MQPSPITPNQSLKILKALAYSFGSGFVGGFLLSVTGIIQAYLAGGPLDLGQSALIGLVLGGVVGGLNTIAVTIKQVFTSEG